MENVKGILLRLTDLVDKGAVDEKDLIHGELRELLAVVGTTGLIQPLPPPRPGLSLNASALLVNARGEPSIGAEVVLILPGAP